MFQPTDRSSTASAPDAEAKRTLLALCWPEGRKSCPRCGADSPYQLAGGRLRCGGCRYTFHDFTGRWLNEAGLSPRQWIDLARSFVREATAREAAAELGIAYNTAYKALTVLRLALLAQEPDAPQLLAPGAPLAPLAPGGEGTAAPRGADLPVYGILTGPAGVFVDLLPELTAESVLHFMRNFRLGVARHGGVIVTDRYKSYDALILCADETLPWDEPPHRRDAVYAESGASPFWDFARPRLRRFKGLSWLRFPLYMKELALRFNMRGADLLPVALAALCAPVPRFAPPPDGASTPEQREQKREHDADDQTGDDGKGEGEAAPADEDVAGQAEQREARQAKTGKQRTRGRSIRPNEQQPHERHAQAQEKQSAPQSSHAPIPPSPD